MANQHPTAPNGDDEGYEGPDIETTVESEPFLDLDGELDESADSYVSPARTERPAQQ
ncbi:hypothetical protein [Microbacterium sp. RU33B]|uniref:hypothetical protein n=1 Tax=Microbacterium sp. RU33B TaxID=1907390 RepID=UPI00095A1FF9|nr:hypothetical protein [Microbacterium sp. RU33B]SIT67485.1 hypothetical protein SAMN05880545_0174 [Microbacterium sp. RU33B]